LYDPDLPPPVRIPRQTQEMTMSVTRDQVVRYRARASRLDAKLSQRRIAEAAWGGLQDSVPRSGVISLHARVEDAQPDSWEHPSLVQIWFRGGADYIVPRVDAGIFTLGSYPRDADEGRRVDGIADAIHRATKGRTLLVREVAALLAADHPTHVRFAAVTGRVHIRWDASNIWLIPVDRPEIDVEDARRELARRFLHWFGPSTVDRLARWTGVLPRDAAATWHGIENELETVEVDGEARSMLAGDVEALRTAKPISGIRLLPFDDPLTKIDKDYLVADETLRNRVFPPTGQSVGHIPGAVLVAGEIVGSWQRQQRKVAIHPWAKLTDAVREAIEQEALAFPIAATARATVTWA
jgi:Winged helix DNA-binding domain